MIAIATRYSGEEGAALLRADGYPEEMIAAMQGAGTRTIKCRGGMGLLGVIGKYGMYRFANTLALLEHTCVGQSRNDPGGRPGLTTPGTATRLPATLSPPACKPRIGISTICATLAAAHPVRQESGRKQDGRVALLHRNDGTRRQNVHHHAGIFAASDQSGYVDSDTAVYRHRPLPGR